MIKIKKLSCNFSGHVYFIAADSRSEVISYLNKKYKSNLEKEDDKGILGTSFSTELASKFYYHIWIKKSQLNFEFFQVIQHEALHTAIAILLQCGCWLTNSSEEAYTYLTDDLAKQIYNQIKTVR